MLVSSRCAVRTREREFVSSLLVFFSPCLSKEEGCVCNSHGAGSEKLAEVQVKASLAFASGRKHWGSSKCLPQGWAVTGWPFMSALLTRVLSFLSGGGGPLWTWFPRPFSLDLRVLETPDFQSGWSYPPPAPNLAISLCYHKSKSNRVQSNTQPTTHGPNQGFIPSTALISNCHNFFCASCMCLDCHSGHLQQVQP